MATTPLTFLSTYNTPTSRLSANLQTWLPVLLCANIFVIESTAAFGADQTSAPLHHFFQLILGAAVDHDWSSLHHIIRKTGHFSGYGLFSLVCFRGFWLSLRKSTGRFRRGSARQLASHALAIAVTFLVAGADELHQTFLPNRTGMFSDVLLDTSGAITLQFALFLILAAMACWSNRPAHDEYLRINLTLQRKLSSAA